MHALSMLEPDVALYAVEANPTMVPILRSVLRHEQRAAVIPGALDYESDSQTVDFYPNSNFLRSAVKPDGETTAVPVPRLTMAGLLEERCVDSYDLPIMDIEGAEAGLLIDDADSLTKCEVVIAELHTRTFRGPNMYHGYHVARRTWSTCSATLASPKSGKTEPLTCSFAKRSVILGAAYECRSPEVETGIQLEASGSTPDLDWDRYLPR